MATDPRWTPATEAIVAKALAPHWYDGRDATSVLAALADAGLLLPPDGVALASAHAEGVRAGREQAIDVLRKIAAGDEGPIQHAVGVDAHRAYLAGPLAEVAANVLADVLASLTPTTEEPK